jgi:aminoglycoside phosphotransferase family enzyme
VLEWAVKMRAFPADATLDREAQVSAEQIDAIADRVAAFHGAVDCRAGGQRPRPAG